MTKADRKAVQGKSLRRSMMQLHTWAGLPLGWIFFFIFIMGALSFYHQEITVWMQPETHKVRPSGTGADEALAVLYRKAPAAGPWTISLSSERAPYITAAWQDPSATQHGGRPGMKRLVINPENGEVIQARPTAGGSFLYRLHVQLFGLERMTGMTLIAIATLVMLLALVSGLFVHATIFKDFFTFRPRRGKLSWRDAHNATAVFSYPFHIIITLSGLLLLCPTIMGPVIQANYDTDTRSFIMASRGMGMPAQAVSRGEMTGERGEKGERAGRPVEGAGRQEARGGERGPGAVNSEGSGRRGGADARDVARSRGTEEQIQLTALSPLVQEASGRWKSGVGSITITNPSGPDARIELREAHASVLRGGSGAAEKMIFDGKSGKRLELVESVKPSATFSIWQTLKDIHRGHFATPLVRFLLFASGLCGAGMVATGLVMWNISRKKRKNAQGNPPFSHRLVESLNIAVIPGLFIAIASYLTCSRLIPAEMAGRVELERQIFFAVWVLCLVHAMVRTTKSRAWIEQFVAAGTLFVLLPMINAITGGAHLLSSMRHGLWSIAGFDVMALIFGLAFFGIAGKIFRYASLASAREYEEGETGKAFQFEPVPIDSGGHP